MDFTRLMLITTQVEVVRETEVELGNIIFKFVLSGPELLTLAD